MSYQYLAVEEHGATTVVTMNKPPVNAVNLAMYEEIRDLFGRFDEVLSGVKAVVLTSALKHFCAGNEVEEFFTLSEANAAGRMRLVRDAFAAIYDCPVPVVGAVRGAALGTGLAIAASCDVVVAGESARFGTPEVSVGVMGGAAHLGRLVPQPVVRAMYFTAEPWPAADLVRFGSVLRVVPDDEVLDTALGLTEKMTRHSLAALRHAKESLNTVEFMDLKAGYEFEQRMTGRLAAEPDAKEAVAALREKRAPVYRDHR
ncbi:enoyl-CoA hydratase-related protein [Actinocrispum wychmicini]|uniref:Enoyl-CoA hydratase n=1 Tax=Actinocrispum wychmicini TaxID=1213861 RepID=A0A4R2JI96_9PSEU|nr:enoyl-CoA hydratase-related protein [Actinocrispum wychmicini]TCO59623.1 enoyl-CoA hydratase [Actinocrispum wychmicini]